MLVSIRPCGRGFEAKWSRLRQRLCDRTCPGLPRVPEFLSFSLVFNLFPTVFGFCLVSGSVFMWAVPVYNKFSLDTMQRRFSMALTLLWLMQTSRLLVFLCNFRSVRYCLGAPGGQLYGGRPRSDQAWVETMVTSGGAGAPRMRRGAGGRHPPRGGGLSGPYRTS